jgi:hypothetical protein
MGPRLRRGEPEGPFRGRPLLAPCAERRPALDYDSGPERLPRQFRERAQVGPVARCNAMLYGLLEGFRPTSAVRVNRVFAVARASGPADGLALLEGSDIPGTATYPYMHLVRGTLLAEVGRTDEALAGMPQDERVNGFSIDPGSVVDGGCTAGGVAGGAGVTDCRGEVTAATAVSVIGSGGCVVRAASAGSASLAARACSRKMSLMVRRPQKACSP